MSNVAVITPPRPALVAGDKPSPIVPTNIEQVWRFADLVAKSGMAPRGMEKPEAITVAILHGLEVGLTPLMALQRIAVVNGRPTIWGDAAMGLVRASGLCEYAREAIKGDGEKMVAVCEVKRRDETESAKREFSVEDAKKAGLWGKQGPWTQYPKRMLQMRARAFALRDTFADVLGGLYLREEIEDHREARDVTPREDPPAPPLVIDAPLAAPPAEAEQPPAPVAAEPSDGIPPMLDRRTPQNGAPKVEAVAPDPDKDPEGFLKWADGILAKVADPEQLQAAFNDQIEPQRAGLFPPDDDALMAIYGKHEKRLGID